nr:MAG TPA: hypothetical protein [Caudoviricetes sp.]
MDLPLFYWHRLQAPLHWVFQIVYYDTYYSFSITPSLTFSFIV